MPDIQIKNLGISFNGKRILTDVSMSISHGETTCIMAPSGSGKTTLLNLLMGIYKPDNGSISGLENAKIAAVFQDDRLIESMDPVSNIHLVCRNQSRNTIIEEMKSIGLTDCFDQPVCELSGGMRRRVALLRAILSDWNVLLLDEPFQGLDDTSKKATVNKVLQWCHGKTVLMVTHDPDEAKLMQAQIISVKQGFKQ